ncbi:MAG: hypothetical protein ACK52I_12170 [Pseudomonadota bacterium]
MSLATICASFWLRAGLGAPPPGVWLSSTAETEQEVVEFAREALRMVSDAHDWQRLLRTYTVALSPQPEQTVALPADFGRLIPGTVWLSDLAWPATGPVSEVEYEYLRQPPVATSGPVFRIAGGALELLAQPAPGGSLTLRYVTSRPVANGATQRETWAADSDAALVDERLVALAMIALWRDARGLNPEAAAALYSAALAKAKAQDRPLGVMGMGGRRGGNEPVGLPNGSTVGIP